MTTWIVAGILCLAHVAPASAHREDNRKIPVNQFGCGLCHGSGDFDAFTPSSGADLTSFGDQWLSLGSSTSSRSWATMASMNADGDGCTNGYELGDTLGSYPGRSTDPAEPVDSKDPNNAGDCTLPLDEKSWGTLKQLFGD